MIFPLKDAPEIGDRSLQLSQQHQVLLPLRHVMLVKSIVQRMRNVFHLNSSATTEMIVVMVKMKANVVCFL